MDKHRAPIYEKMIAHHFQSTASFHVPGHKNGRGVYPEANAFFAGVMGIDFTEISGLDDLHRPSGAIKDAQELAAACFGAEETLFLVGGSTVGNLALITALCGSDDILIVQRNVHKSVLHGLMLAGAKAVFVSPRWDEDSHLATGACPEDIRRAIEAYPEAKGVLLTNPNYYGMGIDLAPIAGLLRSHGIPLIVDEAHGAHFGLHPGVPVSALSCGADAVVQSTHKMLTAMTMGAMLHLQGELVNRAEVKQRLAMLQSSSPSYPIMASLDLARLDAAVNGRSKIGTGLERIARLRERILALGCYKLVDRKASTTAFETLDPFKLTVSERTGTLDGFMLQEELEKRGCFAELADAEHVLLVGSLASASEDYERLYEALADIAESRGLLFASESEIKGGKRTRRDGNVWGSEFTGNLSEPVSFRMSKQRGEAVAVPIERALGLISAEMIIPYPPGIPLLYPGERLTQACIEELERLAECGARFQGATDEKLKYVYILAE
ncbi:aminotransferase class I/II-fold pyridoxal phosphate-dependent enzyme [Paenibacillus sp. MBLB4367]|uniref:aminotransferase class I/II-fold pyridoxal phosphate-dependent enzyme n=1 Tax=Paenibacillus sp. MBLB4367 TaxID=3384767 RepID=UPI0039082EC7